jgi:molybdenum cofactor synthesis domain-containing protein
VVTASTRAASGVYADTAGPILHAGLHALGFQVHGPLVVPDGEPVAAALREAVAAGYDVVLTTGGTGLAPGDTTPEATAQVLDREVPGLAEAVRHAGIAAGVATAALSRGLAGIAGRTLIVNLPGSAGGCRDGMRVLQGVLVHAVDQVRGGDHPVGQHPVGQHPVGQHPVGQHPVGQHPVGHEPVAHDGPVPEDETRGGVGR